MMRAIALLAAMVLTMLATACSNPNDARGPLVLAAASLHEALNEVADVWTAKGNPRPVLSFGGTPQLARQIEAGAPADLFIAADMQWMDEVARKRLIAPHTRAVIAGNALVLIATRNTSAQASGDNAIAPGIEPGFPLAKALGPGRLAMADPDSVPAGRYARQALETLAVWPSVANRITRTENVRVALALVARGEAPLGIVYASDAKAEPDVRIVGRFPQQSHVPIRYPVARIASSQHRAAEDFRAFLLSDEAQAIFVRHGFSAPEAR